MRERRSLPATELAVSTELRRKASAHQLEHGRRTESSRPSRSDAMQGRLDRESEEWVARLGPGHPRREQTVARLREVLVRVAFHELARRRGQLGSIQGPELEDLGQQAANDALINILGRLDEFRGGSRFTTWAYKFAMFEVSGKVARHAWRRYPPTRQAFAFEELPDRLIPKPSDCVEQQQQLDALSVAIRQLPERQREVFVAIALNDTPPDVLAVELGTNRNAIYKNLFDARRRLRASMAAVGHPVLEQDAT